jgi:hypothetical protein
MTSFAAVQHHSCYRGNGGHGGAVLGGPTFRGSPASQLVSIARALRMAAGRFPLRPSPKSDEAAGGRSRGFTGLILAAVAIVAAFMIIQYYSP